jgi:uncharacterized protein (DUF488 family)
MSAFDLFTIGHSNIPAERFLTMLIAADVTAVADVRSVPLSRFFPWFSAKKLGPLLERSGIAYLRYGEDLGGRPRHSALYRDGVADYGAMAAQADFASGLQRLRADIAQHRVCLMCAEREPLDCHRCLLVARALASDGLAVGHILYDGSVEPHAVTEERLLALDGGADLFVTGQNARLAAAYLRRARAVAHRAPQTGRS